MVDALLDLLPAWPLWTLAISGLLLLRAVAVLAIGPGGAAQRGALALLVGLAVVGQLAFEGPRVALLPLHAAAGFVVLLLPWERPHPEPPPLRLGRNRRRRVTRPVLRAVLATLTVAAVVVWSFLIHG